MIDQMTLQMLELEISSGSLRKHLSSTNESAISHDFIVVGLLSHDLNHEKMKIGKKPHQVFGR